VSSLTREREVVLRVGLLIVLAGLLLSGCAPGPNPTTGEGTEAGFWLGLWHGFIAPVTFVISLFTDSVNLYEVHNTGNWYDVGFFFGFVSSAGGSAASARNR